MCTIQTPYCNTFVLVSGQFFNAILLQPTFETVTMIYAYPVRQYCTLCTSSFFFTPTTNGKFHLTQFFVNICSVVCAI